MFFEIMKILRIFLLATFVFLFTGCETINKKSEQIAKEENKKLSQFIGQPVSELKIVMGNPDSEGKSENGSKLLIYSTKKYGIKCERNFIIDNNEMVIGFTSKGCF